MARNEIAFPEALPLATPFDFGFVSASVGVDSPLGGGQQGTAWEERLRSTYRLQPAFFGHTTTKLETYQAFLHDIALGARPFWLRETISRAHRRLLCGPLADGTRTTFPISCMAPTSVTVLNAGAPVTSGYTVHAVANVLTDNQHSAASSISDLEASDANCTIARETAIAPVGTTSVKVTPVSSVGNIGFQQVDWYPVAATVTELTAIISFLGAGTFQAVIMWFDEFFGWLSSSSANVTGDTSAWVTQSVTATAPASAVYAKIQAFRTTTSANVWYAGALALNRGDYDRSHLPSRAPGLVEFTAAPTDGNRIEAHATGYKLAHCMVDPRAIGATGLTGRSPGNVWPGAIPITEQLQSWT